MTRFEGKNYSITKVGYKPTPRSNSGTGSRKISRPGSRVGSKNDPGNAKPTNTAGQLPRGWMEYQTDDGDVFFHNFYTDESTWTQPMAEEVVKIGKSLPPKKMGHVRADGRSNLPPCAVMVVVLFMLVVGLCRSLWTSIMKCLGLGPPDPNAARMVAQEQDEFVKTLERSEVALAPPLKPPELVTSKPEPGPREGGEEKKNFSMTGMFSDILAASRVSGDDENEYENVYPLDPPTADNFAQWAPKLASVWGHWLTPTERKKLNRLVDQWAQEQVARWKLADRPLRASRSEGEGAPNLERCSNLKAVLQKDLDENHLHEIQRGFDELQQESAQNSGVVVDQLEKLKIDLKQKEYDMMEEANSVEKRRKILLECDPSYSLGLRDVPGIPTQDAHDDTLRSQPETSRSLKGVMLQSTRRLSVDSSKESV